ncbi:hypothetical protein ACHAXM_009093, partial [Skeletonema potamos]
ITTTCLLSDVGGGGMEYDDFANFSSTQLASSSSTTSSTSADTEDTFLSSLQSRLQQVQDNSTRLPLMILDTMLPRQILQIQIQHPTLKALMKHRINEETPTLGMLGMARLSTGQTVPLKTGVEVEIIQMEKASDSAPPNTSSTNRSSGGGVEEEGWDISLRAGRRFIIDGEVEKTEDGWTEARVKFLDSSEEEENEISSAMKSPSSAESIGDRLSVARAIQKAKEFTVPNMNMKNSLSLVDRWIELAKQNERHPGQIDALLKQLGEIPPEHEPTERALWVGALINPLPSMGVAMEIRPALLVSKKAEERVQVALDGLLKSIRHMDGSQRLN